MLVPAWNGPDLQCRRDGELSAGRTAFPKRGSRWSASRCRMGRAEIKFPPSVRHSRKTGCRTQKEVFYHAANPNAYEPVPNSSTRVIPSVRDTNSASACLLSAAERAETPARLSSRADTTASLISFSGLDIVSVLT